MLRTSRTFVALALLAGGTLLPAAPLAARQNAPAWSANLEELRRVASLVPGARPLRLNMLKFAASLRTKNFSVEGAPAEPSEQARTAFQVVYPDGTVMVDSGMDLQVHRFFGRGKEEPYDAEAAAAIDRALVAARLIVVTHEHGDHVAGVIHGAHARELAPKTLLTRAQVDTLLHTPQMPELALTPERAARFIVIDYDRYFPLAPGMALLKAAGHTPGSQMVYVALASGREYLLIGDATWHMDGVRLVRGKAAPWVHEDVAAVMAQLRWLHDLSESNPNLVIIASHDQEQHEDLLAKGLIGGQLE